MTTTSYAVGASVYCPINKQGRQPLMMRGVIQPRASLGEGTIARPVRQTPPRNAHGWYWVEVQDEVGGKRMLLAHESEIQYAE